MKAWTFIGNDDEILSNDSQNWKEIDIADKFKAKILNEKKIVNDLSQEIKKKALLIRSSFFEDNLRQIIHDIISKKLIKLNKAKFRINNNGKNEMDYKATFVDVNEEDKTEFHNLFTNYNILSFYLTSYINLIGWSTNEIIQVSKLSNSDSENILFKKILIENINMVYDQIKKMFYFFAYSDWLSEKISTNISKNILNKQEKWMHKFMEFFDLDDSKSLEENIWFFDLARNVIQHRDKVNSFEGSQTQYTPSIKNSHKLQIDFQNQKNNKLSFYLKNSDRLILISDSFDSKTFLDKILGEEAVTSINFKWMHFDVFNLSIEALKYIDIFFKKLEFKIHRKYIKYFF
ncbi:hypothetical protein ESOMN_v1c06110 [Williamsoniiplasma somnilux]|uniref:Uncharacterized protein n=1 Tax=Williamsoniiplasma somnilux TaxID=215578 RepID=A0A2K8P274_9MOLU|nr:hypothetical protein [Williamsoniiplasma somnilux]ATZ18993.1 hypothetical protein ESOMN_v1c06110 [Williamsoniiplasma somnilux]